MIRKGRKYPTPFVVKLAPGYNKTPSVALCNSQNTLSGCVLIFVSHRVDSNGAIDAFKNKQKEFKYYCCTQKHMFSSSSHNYEVDLMSSSPCAGCVFED